MIVEITSPHIIHSTKPRQAALSRCPLTIMQVLSDWMVISIIFAAHTKKHTATGCNEDKNSDIYGLLYIGIFYMYFNTKTHESQEKYTIVEVYKKIARNNIFFKKVLTNRNSYDIIFKYV